MNKYVDEFISDAKVVIDLDEIKSREDLIKEGKIAYKHNCVLCDREFYTNSSMGKFCGCCHLELKCEVCGEYITVNKNLNYYKRNKYVCSPCKSNKGETGKYIDKFISDAKVVIDSDEIKSREDIVKQDKTAYRHKCIICDREFYNNCSIGKFCGCCHVELKCKICGEYKKVSSHMKHYEDNEYICLECSNDINLHSHESRMKAYKTLVENGSWEKFQESLHTPEARRKAYETRKRLGTLPDIHSPSAIRNNIAAKRRNGTYKRWSELMKTLAHTEEAKQKRQKTRMENGANQRFIDRTKERNAKLWEKDEKGNFIMNDERSQKWRNSIRNNMTKAKQTIIRDLIDIIEDIDKVKSSKNNSYNKSKINILNNNYSDTDVKIIIKEAKKNNIETLSYIDEEFLKFDVDKRCNISCRNYNTCENKNALKNKYGWCKDSPNINPNCGFNREKFYSSSYNVTTYESVNEMVTEFNKLNGISGVWAVYCNDICLDVCETQDIGNEMYQTVRKLNYCKDKNDEELQDRKYNWKKVRDIAECGKLDFVVVARDVEDKIERMKIEAQYAHDNKAKYWSPAPGQMNMIGGEGG